MIEPISGHTVTLMMLEKGHSALQCHVQTVIKVSI